MLNFWQNFMVLHNPVKTEPNLSKVAGNNGESEFAELLGQIKRIRVFKNKRIKDDGAGLHEIDFIVLDGKKIYLIEIKNWSGSVSVNEDDQWIQKSKQRSINHSNPLKKLLRNTSFFVAHLRSLGFDLKGYEIYPQVIFMNNSLRLTKELKNSIYIKTGRDFLAMLNRKKRFLKFKKQITFDEKLVNILNSLTIFSKLHLYGGAELCGNIRYFVINGKRTRLPKHFRTNCSLKWNRKIPFSFLSSLIGKKKKLKIKSKIFKVKPNDSVGFVEAGKSGVKLIKFGIIEKIVKDDEA